MQQRNPAATTLARGGAGWAPRHSDQRRVTHTLGDSSADNSFTKESVFSELRNIAADYPCDSPFFIDPADGKHKLKQGASPSLQALISSLSSGSTPIQFVLDALKDPGMTRVYGVVDFAEDLLIASGHDTSGVKSALSQRPFESRITATLAKITATGFSQRINVQRSVLLARSEDDVFDYDRTPATPTGTGVFTISPVNSDEEFFATGYKHFPDGPKINSIAEFAKAIEYHSLSPNGLVVKRVEKDSSGRFILKRIWNKSQSQSVHYSDRQIFSNYLNSFAPQQIGQTEDQRVSIVDSVLANQPTGLTVTTMFGIPMAATLAQWNQVKASNQIIAGQPVNVEVDIIQELESIPYGSSYSSIDPIEKVTANYSGIRQLSGNRLFVEFETNNWKVPGPWNAIRPIDVIVALESLSPDELSRLNSYFSWNHDGGPKPQAPASGGIGLNINFGPDFAAMFQGMNNAYAAQRKKQADNYAAALIMQAAFDLSYQPEKAKLAGELAKDITTDKPGIDESDLRANWADMIRWISDNKQLPYSMARIASPYAEKRLENIVEFKEKAKTQREKDVNYDTNALFLWESQAPTGLAKVITIGLMRVGLHLGLGRIDSAQALFGCVREFFCKQIQLNTLSTDEIAEIGRLLKNAGSFVAKGSLPTPKPISIEASQALEELASRVTQVEINQYRNERMPELQAAADDLKAGVFTEEDAPELALKALVEDRKIDLEIENARKEVEAAEREKSLLEERKVLAQERLDRATGNSQLDGWFSDTFKKLESKFRNEMKRVARRIERTFGSISEEVSEVLQPKSVADFFKDTYDDIEDEAKRAGRRVDSEVSRFGRRIDREAGRFGRRIDKTIQRSIKSIAEHAPWINGIAMLIWWVPVVGWLLSLTVLAVVASAEIAYALKVKRQVKDQLREALHLLRLEIDRLNAEIAELERQAEEAERERMRVRQLADKDKAARLLRERDIEEQRAAIRREFIIGSAVTVGAATLAERNGLISKSFAVGLGALSLSVLAYRSLQGSFSATSQIYSGNRPVGLPPPPEPPVDLVVAPRDTSKDQKSSPEKDAEAKRRSTDLR